MNALAKQQRLSLLETAASACFQQSPVCAKGENDMASATWGTKGPHPPKFSSLGAFCPRYFFFFPRAGGHWAVGGGRFSVFSGTTGLGKGDVGVRNFAKLCRNVTAQCRKCETFLKLIFFGSKERARSARIGGLGA